MSKILNFLFILLCSFNLAAQEYFDKYVTPTKEYIFSELTKKDPSLNPKKAKYIYIDSVGYRINNKIELDFGLRTLYTDEIIDIKFVPKTRINGKREKAKIIVTTDNRPGNFLTLEAVDYENKNHNPDAPKVIIFNNKRVIDKSVPEFLMGLDDIDDYQIMIFQKPPYTKPYPQEEYGEVAKYGLIIVRERK